MSAVRPLCRKNVLEGWGVASVDVGPMRRITDGRDCRHTQHLVSPWWQGNGQVAIEGELAVGRRSPELPQFPQAVGIDRKPSSDRQGEASRQLDWQSPTPAVSSPPALAPNTA